MRLAVNKQKGIVVRVRKCTLDQCLQGQNETLAGLVTQKASQTQHRMKNQVFGWLTNGFSPPPSPPHLLWMLDVAERSEAIIKADRQYREIGGERSDF